jgi:hypothetical protein
VISNNLNNGSYYLIDIYENNKSRTSEEETNRRRAMVSVHVRRALAELAGGSGSTAVPRP